MWRSTLALIAILLLPSGAIASTATDSATYDRNVHDSCVQAAAPKNGGAGAERYCSCIVRRLDLLPYSQRLQVTPQSDVLIQAETYCNALAAGQDPNGAVFDKGVHDSCVTSAVAKGAMPAKAEAYCTCVVGELDQVPVSGRVRLTPQSDAVTHAEAVCNARIPR